MGARLRVLVVDDIEANRNLIERFVSRLGHNVVSASNGQQAIDISRAELPDLVLMDIMMPGMDGNAAAAEIRRLCGDRWVPIIFLSARISEADQLLGLAVGDDYLTKPVNLALLKAKIEVMARIAEMQQRIADHAARLAAYRESNELELQFTRHVLEHVVGHENCPTGEVKRWIQPARQLSGDVIAHAYSPNGMLNILFADSTGHGLAAAVSAVPVVDTFQSMTRRGYGLESILTELNAKLHRLLPANRFVAAALAAIDPYRGTITLWNGGIPPVIFLSADGELRREWRPVHPPLGILPEADFDPSGDSWQWDVEGELLIYSDGLIEAVNAQGEPFGATGLQRALTNTTAQDAFRALCAAVTTHLDGHDNHDDLSLASVACTASLHQSPAPTDLASVDTPQFAQSNWSLHLCFEVAEIRAQAIQPLLTRWLNQLSLTPRQFGEILLILNELCNNAIDHGLLGMDSSLKADPDGYTRFLQTRSQRLEALAEGKVNLKLTQVVANGRRCLQMRVRDSGRGFDHQRLLSAPPAAAPLAHGHGIALVRRLAQNLSYLADGTEAVAEYALQENV